jgi:hypothetical protein
MTEAPEDDRVMDPLAEHQHSDSMSVAIGGQSAISSEGCGDDQQNDQKAFILVILLPPHNIVGQVEM